MCGGVVGGNACGNGGGRIELCTEMFTRKHDIFGNLMNFCDFRLSKAEHAQHVR